MGHPDRQAQHRSLASQGLSVREIAEKTGQPKSTVHRDLAGWDDPLEPEGGYVDAETIGPVGRTPDGTPFYALGRFDRDRKFLARVADLRDLHPVNARRLAARERAAELQET